MTFCAEGSTHIRRLCYNNPINNQCQDSALFLSWNCLCVCTGCSGWSSEVPLRVPLQEYRLPYRCVSCDDVRLAVVLALPTNVAAALLLTSFLYIAASACVFLFTVLEFVCSHHCLPLLSHLSTNCTFHMGLQIIFVQLCSFHLYVIPMHGTRKMKVWVINLSI